MKFDAKAINNGGSVAVLIRELRERISDIIEKDDKFDDDFYLHRWLLSQQSKVDRTEGAIRESIVWREENNVEILGAKDWDPTGLIQEIPVYMDKADKTGQPVMKVNGDKLDLSAVIKKHGKETALKFIIEIYAKLERLMIEHNKFNNCESQDPNPNKSNTKRFFSDSSALIVIGCFKDFSLWNAKSLDVMTIILEGTKIGTRYFPCMATDIFITHTNRFSAMVFKMIKPLLAAIPSNIECFDSDQTKWSQELLDSISYYPTGHDFHTLSKSKSATL